MNLSYIPSPSFSEITLGPIVIRMYAVCILTGIIVAVWMTTMRFKKMGGRFEQVLDLTLWTVPLGIVGARIYHILTTLELYFGPHGNWVDMFRIWKGGLGIWGGVALGSLVAWLVCRHRHYPTALLADAAAPALLVAQAIGRLGNWFNQELYGAPTTLPWGLKITDKNGALGALESCYNGRPCPQNTLFHPTFLYELLWNLIGAFILIYLSRHLAHKLKAGTLFTLYVAWYTLGRTWIENLRIDFAHNLFGVRINVWVSAIVFILAVITTIIIQKYGKDRQILIEKLHAVSELEEKKLANS